MQSMFFWEFPRRLKYKSRRFGTQCRFHRPGRSGTSAFIMQTSGKFPKEHRLHSKHGESLKTTIRHFYGEETTRILCSLRIRIRFFHGRRRGGCPSRKNSADLPALMVKLRTLHLFCTSILASVSYQFHEPVGFSHENRLWYPFDRRLLGLRAHLDLKIYDYKELYFKLDYY